MRSHRGAHRDPLCYGEREHPALATWTKRWPYSFPIGRTDGFRRSPTLNHSARGWDKMSYSAAPQQSLARAA
ncbi:hypothetical protein SPHINGO8AM_130247 [Sphingomonas sp. 8AM]|nr:hypothetical protein SPHINGO8AM_130247 [Sphingomonas sp. 8AM]